MFEDASAVTPSNTPQKGQLTIVTDRSGLDLVLIKKESVIAFLQDGQSGERTSIEMTSCSYSAKRREV